MCRRPPSRRRAEDGGRTPAGRLAATGPPSPRPWPARTGVDELDVRSQDRSSVEGHGVVRPRSVHHRRRHQHDMGGPDGGGVDEHLGGPSVTLSRRSARVSWSPASRWTTTSARSADTGPIRGLAARRARTREPRTPSAPVTCTRIGSESASRWDADITDDNRVASHSIDRMADGDDLPEERPEDDPFGGSDPFASLPLFGDSPRRSPARDRSTGTRLASSPPGRDRRHARDQRRPHGPHGVPRAGAASPGRTWRT